MILYNCVTNIDREGQQRYKITKFNDGDVESSYFCSSTECECPAGVRPSCRHRQMLPEMIARHMVNSHLFWDFDRRQSCDFEGNPARHTVAQDTKQETSQETILAPNLPPTVVQTVDREILPPAEPVPAGLHGEEETFISNMGLPKGVFIYPLDDPTALHNAIADAVGEPEAKLVQTVDVAPTQPWRRM